MKGDHGDAEGIVAVRAGPAQKAGGLCPDKGHIVADQIVRFLVIFFGFVDRLYDPMFLFHKPHLFSGCFLSL